jgi:hypothetical protein
MHTGPKQICVRAHVSSSSRWLAAAAGLHRSHAEENQLSRKERVSPDTGGCSIMCWAVEYGGSALGSRPFPFGFVWVGEPRLLELCCGRGDRVPDWPDMRLLLGIPTSSIPS